MVIEENENAQILIYEKKVNAGKLMDELFETVEQLKPTRNDDGSFNINVRLFSDESSVKLIIPEDIDKTLIDVIVELHDVSDGLVTEQFIEPIFGPVNLNNTISETEVGVSE